MQTATLRPRASLLAAAAAAALVGCLAPAASAGTTATPGTGASAPQLACQVARPGHARCLIVLQSPRAIPPPTAGSPAAGGRGRRAWARKTWSRPTGCRSAAAPGRRSRSSIAYNTPHLAQYSPSTGGASACRRDGRGCLRSSTSTGRPAPARLRGRHRLGPGDHARRRHGLRGLPALPHPARRGRSSEIGDLAAAENTAARLGAQVISNSYGSQENGYAMAFAKAYDHPGHTIVASSGDGGFTAANFPADLATVTAAGGTQLARARSARGWSETVWNHPASGQAAAAALPTWPSPPGSTTRTAPGGPSPTSPRWPPNIPIYKKNYGGWVTVGGTSVAAPLIAGHLRPGWQRRQAPARQRVPPPELSCSTSPPATTPTTSRPAPAAATTCASPRKATTPRPAWAPPTEPAPASQAAQLSTAASAGRRSGGVTFSRSGNLWKRRCSQQL